MSLDVERVRQWLSKQQGCPCMACNEYNEPDACQIGPFGPNWDGARELMGSFDVMRVALAETERACTDMRVKNIRYRRALERIAGDRDAAATTLCAMAAEALHGPEFGGGGR